MNFKIVVDSTTCFTEEELKKYDIKRASLDVMDGENTYKELEIENQLIYDKLAEGHRLTTSQPSPADFLHLYEECLKQGADRVFVITLAEPLSGTYQSAMLAQSMMDDPDKIHIFKSLSASIGNELLTLELVRLIEEGKTEEEIISNMNIINQNVHVNFTIENLIHLMRSGRLSRAKALIGSVLRVKPLLETNEGRLELGGSARTHRKVIAMMLGNIKKTTVNAKKIYIRVISKNSIENAKALEQEIRNTFKNIKLTFTEYVGPVFSLHLGTNAYGLAWSSE